MAPNPSLTTPKCLLLLLIFLSLIAIYLSFTLQSSPNNHHLPQFNVGFYRTVDTLPSWYKFLANEFIDRKMRIGLVDVELRDGLLHGENVDTVNVKFQRVSEQIKWDHLFPGWIDEDNTSRNPDKCPTIPLPNLKEYRKVDVVVARMPCCAGNDSRDVYRLQVNLVVANLLVTSGWYNHDVYRTVYAVFIGECEPMFEIFRCDDLLWHQKDVRVYMPNLNKLKQKVVMPVGSCQLARPFSESGNEIWRRYAFSAAKNKTMSEPRQAYVTVLHSSENYVCGAIALAQSIRQSNSSKDLVLLADSSISPKSLRGLLAAGWKVKRIRRIRSPHADKNAYNEWNYSKLRIWEKLAAEYDKVIFVDSDVVVVRNMDEFFLYPELSAAENDRHIFNSGVMVVEPSACTFQTMMRKRYEVVSYNRGDQGFLNEMFVWWHRLPLKANRLKFFGYVNNGNNWIDQEPHKLPDDVYAIHYLGLKPWKCDRQDHDCNWDKLRYHKFASDSVHVRWWQVYNKMPKSLQQFCASTTKIEHIR